MSPAVHPAVLRVLDRIDGLIADHLKRMAATGIQYHQARLAAHLKRRARDRARWKAIHDTATRSISRARAVMKKSRKNTADHKARMAEQDAYVRKLISSG